MNAENGGRAVRDDGELDAVEMRQALLEIIGVADQLDRFVGLELDEFERAGADRVGAHVGGRHMAGIDRRIAGGEQRQQRRLRPLQIEGDLEVAVGRDVVDELVPGLARVLAELLRRFAHQHVEGAFDVGRGERLAVVPFDALVQFEGQRLVVGAPGPALRLSARSGTIESRRWRDLPLAMMRSSTNRNSRSRSAAADALGQVGPGAKAAVQLLIKTMKDKSPKVRGAVARTLGEIGPEAKDAVPVLMEALQTRQGFRVDNGLCHVKVEVRMEAARAWWWIGLPPALLFQLSARC